MFKDNTFNVKLSLSLIFTSVCFFCFAQTPVSNATELNTVRNNMDGNYIQTSDINLEAIENWMPIGNWDNPFTGIYDGGGFRIINLTISREDADEIGLFGAVIGQGAEIKNLRLENVNITGGEWGVAGITATLYEGARIADCYVTGSISGRMWDIAGIAAYAGEAVTIERCFFAGILTGGVSVGGIVGYLEASTIRNCYAAGAVISENEAGGIIYYNDGGTIINSYSCAYISGNPDLIGGIAGFGGQDGTVTGCFWDVEISSVENSQGGTGLNVTQMLLQETYSEAEWDFEQVWAIVNEESYPYFQRQEEPGIHNYPPESSPPTNLSWVPGEGYIDLIWNAPSYGEWLGFNVYKNDNFLARVDENITQYRDEEVENYEFYEYYVTAQWEDDNESIPSNKIVVIPHEPFAGGSGTVDDPYHVASAQNLNDTRYHKSAHLIQTEDINLGVPPWNSEEGWQPIGYWNSHDDNMPFTGSYDGNGFLINGLTINAPETDYLGLFGYLDNAIIQNMSFENIVIIGNEYVAAVSPMTTGETTISDCFVSGEISGRSYIGGIIANHRGGDIINCETEGSISGHGWIGGILADMLATSGNIINCRSTATITAEHQFVGGIAAANRSTMSGCFYSGVIAGGTDVGGLAGFNGGVITKSYAEGSLTSHGVWAGGIAGRNDATISYCYADMEVIGFRWFGGFVGQSYGQGLITNCYVRGTVTASDEVNSSMIGGLIGVNSANITNSYSTARVTGPNVQIGGLVGRHTGGNVINSYWDIETSNQQASAIGIGRQTRQMTYPYDATTYVDWDFEEIWTDDENAVINDGYPFLFWQELPPVLNPPAVIVSIVTEDGNDYSVLNWEAVEGANSYLIYASENPFAEDWGEPIAIITETQYSEPVAQNRTRFYYVVATTE